MKRLTVTQLDKKYYLNVKVLPEYLLEMKHLNVLEFKVAYEYYLVFSITETVMSKIYI